ncbi:MAG: hypothetical protein IJM59_08795 [Proteobacteria bacterium]|nr:hypothetical protein [Pseudomonadota bacterium]
MLVDADEKSYEYSLSVNTVEEWCCCDEHDYYIGRSKKRCSLASGCSCGKEKCRYAEVCEDSKCTDNDITELCGIFYEYDMEYEGFQYKDSNCYCKGTVHSITSTDYNYECTPFGWLCDERVYVTECSCGDKVCSLGEYCVMPGVCANPKRP